MKILIVTTISNTINAFLVPHIKLLIEEGNEVELAFNPVEEIRYDLIQLGCKIHHVYFQRDPFKKENITAYKKIKQIVSRGGYGLVHVHTPVASLLTRLACRKITDVKILYTAHGFHFFAGAPWRNWILYYSLEKIAARWTDGLIIMNEEDYKSAQKLKLRKNNSIYKVNGVGIDLKRFIPQTVETKIKLREEYNYSLDSFILIYVAELNYNKHQDLLIKAVSKVKRKIPNIKLLLVGNGNLENKYKKLVRSLGMENNVELLGQRKDISNLLSISDLTVSTSRREGLPVNIMEAMATSLPLIVTDCRGNRDLVQNGVNGIVIKNDDVEACAKAIEVLFNSKQLRHEFGVQSKAHIQNYSLEIVLGEMKEIYHENGVVRKHGEDTYEVSI